MLKRQKIILASLYRANKPLSPTMFVKLMFLLCHETELENDRTFYGFVPYKYGPFSFSLYRELGNLRQNGYVSLDEEYVEICRDTFSLTMEKIRELPSSDRRAVERIVDYYGKQNQAALVKKVYSKYPWYAINSEITDLKPRNSLPVKTAPFAVYTVGYEGKSIDSFFNDILQWGIKRIIDVRANALSRRYGFSKNNFSEIANKLGIDYRHMPNLGIPRKYRVDLTDFDSYQRLLYKYEREILPTVEDEIKKVGDLMQKSPAVFVCVEKDFKCCHRSRLAKAVSLKTGMEISHL